MFPSKPLQIAFCATSLLMNLIAPAIASPYTLPLPLAKRATPQSSVNPKALPNTSITYRQIPREPMPFPIDVDQPVRRYSLSDMVASLRLSSLHLRASSSYRLVHYHLSSQYRISRLSSSFCSRKRCGFSTRVPLYSVRLSRCPQ